MSSCFPIIFQMFHDRLVQLIYSFIPMQYLGFLAPGYALLAKVTAANILIGENSFQGWDFHIVRRETPTKLALDNFAWPLG